MNDWIKSGAEAPRACDDDNDNNTDDERRHERRCRAATGTYNFSITVVLAVLLLAPWPHLGHARDNGRYAGTNPELKSWFESLRSGKGPCCSDADGTALSDVDWESSSGHYRVRLDGEWVDVPDDAVITVPNRIGRTMVWPMYRDGKMTPRCFMPGSMT